MDFHRGEDLLWFSHTTTEYEVRDTGREKKFVLKKDKPQIKLDWDNCAISIAHLLPNGKIRFMIRSKTNRNSEYMGNIPTELRFMITIDVNPSEISEPRAEMNYSVYASKRRRLPESVRQIVHDRWVFDLGGEAQVWEWARTDREIRSSRVYGLRQEIRKFIDSPDEGMAIVGSSSSRDATFFRINVEKIQELIPVIYQPAVDSLDNFLREVHCAKSDLMGSSGNFAIDVEVTLLFNNEQLRKYRLADGIYKWIRKLLYGRQIDVETFRIHFVQDKLDENCFFFKGIYSGDYDLEYDTIHLDNEPVEHKIKYYVDDVFHPIVFINTSNHAMAENDNNQNLWKWEYVPWLNKAPVVLGSKSRREIDRQFRSIFRWF